MDIKGKSITVVGLARSGVGAANMLARLGAEVTVTDTKKNEDLERFLCRLDLRIKRALGGHPKELFENPSLIVVSPGVPLAIAPLREAAAKGVKIIGELELAYHAVDEFAMQSQREFTVHDTQIKRPQFLAITGANGKSTTTSLLYAMLGEGGVPSLMGGNIGNALTEEILSLAEGERKEIDYIVAEVSSFQLDAIEEFKPRGAAILNVTPDHLDRYPSLEAYAAAKCRIFENQGEDDFLVLNADDPFTAAIEEKYVKGRLSKPRLFYFSRAKEVRGAFFLDGLIRFDLPGIELPPSARLDPGTFKIKGVHNIENAMAAALMALLAGCGFDAVRSALEKFPGLEHRLEFVREIGGVRFINDSKGTNVGAVMKSLESFSEPVVLIAGGRDKDSDFSLLRPLVNEKVKALVLIGEAKEKIRKAVGSGKEIFMTDDFREATRKAKEMAEPGDVVLLSPACASFDMFKDFEDRGRRFKKAVEEL